MATILIAHDHCYSRDLVTLGLRDDGHEIAAADDPTAIDRQMQIMLPDMVLLDRMAINFDTNHLLQSLKRQFPGIPMLTYRVCNDEDLDELKRLIPHILQGNYAQFLAGYS